MVFEFIRGQQSTRLLLLLGGGRLRAALGRFGRATPARRRVDDGRRCCLLVWSPRRGRTGVVVVRSRAAAQLGVELFGGERARDSSAAVEYAVGGGLAIPRVSTEDERRDYQQ